MFSYCCWMRDASTAIQDQEFHPFCAYMLQESFVLQNPGTVEPEKPWNAMKCVRSILHKLSTIFAAVGLGTIPGPVRLSQCWCLTGFQMPSVNLLYLHWWRQLQAAKTSEPKSFIGWCEASTRMNDLRTTHASSGQLFLSSVQHHA